MLSKQEKVWIEELADQYEEWIDNPPMYAAHKTVDGEPRERYTCYVLDEGDWGFNTDWDVKDAGDYLIKVWEPVYGYTHLPVGSVFKADRVERREEFCEYMAETLRSYL